MFSIQGPRFWPPLGPAVSKILGTEFVCTKLPQQKIVFCIPKHTASMGYPQFSRIILIPNPSSPVSANPRLLPCKVLPYLFLKGLFMTSVKNHIVLLPINQVIGCFWTYIWLYEIFPRGAPRVVVTGVQPSKQAMRRRCHDLIREITERVERLRLVTWRKLLESQATWVCGGTCQTPLGRW